jgi:hypothetical protein
MLTSLIDLSWHQQGEWICEDGGWIYEKIEKKGYCFLDKNNKKKVGWGVELSSIDSFNFFDGMFINNFIRKYVSNFWWNRQWNIY